MDYEEQGLRNLFSRIQSIQEEKTKKISLRIFPIIKKERQPKLLEVSEFKNTKKQTVVFRFKDMYSLKEFIKFSGEKKAYYIDHGIIYARFFLKEKNKLLLMHLAQECYAWKVSEETQREYLLIRM